MACLQCGAPLTPDDVFCPKCGARQSAGLPVPADAQRAALVRVLGHQYDIVRLLGRGGMGAVYLAREKALERAVAIKVLPPETATDADTRERFRREARVAAKLTHPNIVPLHSFGDVEGMLYFVMGYVKGESLAERMRREGKLPEEDVRRILAEVADALHYAHKQGVVHRDIKPDNILLEDESSRPMLTDFGVAKAKASGTTLTEAGAVVGTPYYMSPEQASGVKEIDGRTDLYSLGVMGYQMLSGRLPFEGESFQDVLVQHVTREPAPLSALVPDAAQDLTAAVMRCLAKEPAKRWDDGRQLREAIGETGADPLEDDESTPGYHVRSIIPTSVAIFGGISFYALACYLFPGIRMASVPWWLSPAVVGGSVSIIVAGTVAVERWRGTAWPALSRSSVLAPRAWPFWWPAKWRRPYDLWPRLPLTLRQHKSVLGWGGLLAVIGWVVMGFDAVLEAQGRDPLAIGVIGIALLAVGGTPALVSALRYERWGRTLGLSKRELTRLLWAPPARPERFRTPKFAALLLPAPGRTVADRGSAEPRSPEEYARGIRDLVGQLPSGTQVTVSEAADAARQLLGTVAALDAELAKLAQDADPQELEAVEAKLRALGPETQDEDDVRRQKRAVLVPQRELLRSLNQRLAVATDRRARLVDLLRTMWLQVANLRAEAAHDTLAVTEVSGRIKALCTEIDTHVRAAETVRAVTG